MRRDQPAVWETRPQDRGRFYAIRWYLCQLPWPAAAVRQSISSGVRPQFCALPPSWCVSRALPTPPSCRVETEVCCREPCMWLPVPGASLLRKSGCACAVTCLRDMTPSSSPMWPIILALCSSALARKVAMLSDRMSSFPRDSLELVESFIKSPSSFADASSDFLCIPE